MESSDLTSSLWQTVQNSLLCMRTSPTCHLQFQWKCHQAFGIILQEDLFFSSSERTSKDWDKNIWKFGLECIRCNILPVGRNSRRILEPMHKAWFGLEMGTPYRNWEDRRRHDYFEFLPFFPSVLIDHISISVGSDIQVVELSQLWKLEAGLLFPGWSQVETRVDLKVVFRSALIETLVPF